MNSCMIIYAIALFVAYAHNMSSSNSCQGTLPSKRLSEAIAQDAAHKYVKDIADSHGGETSASRGVNEVMRDNRESCGRFSKRGKKG